MERWSRQCRSRITDQAADAFLADLQAVCVKHGLWLSHEDGGGAFIVEKLDCLGMLDWMMDAMLGHSMPCREG